MSSSRRTNLKLLTTAQQSFSCILEPSPSLPLFPRHSPPLSPLPSHSLFFVFFFLLDGFVPLTNTTNLPPLTCTSSNTGKRSSYKLNGITQLQLVSEPAPGRPPSSADGGGTLSLDSTLGTSQNSTNLQPQLQRQAISCITRPESVTVVATPSLFLLHPQ